jgi:uncharacterized protein
MSKGMDMPSAEELIAYLRLQPHPREGGYFRETYRAAEAGPTPARYGSPRAASTAIYYLLTPQTCSALHRLQSDEVFHFYRGGPVRMVQLWPDGSAQSVVLGSDLLAGQKVQLVVPRGVWQGSFLEAGAFALLGCTVAPGFDFADYEGGKRDALQRQYPALAALIERLTLE